MVNVHLLATASDSRYVPNWGVGGGAMEAQSRLSATAQPRRNQALAFIVDRIVETGICPTFGEIGRALGVSPTRAGQLVDQLVAAGAIERTVGSQRNLRVRNVAPCRAMVEVALRRLGWIMAEAGDAEVRALSLGHVSVLAPSERLPNAG